MSITVLPAAYCADCAAVGKTKAISAHAAHYRDVRLCRACAARRRHQTRPPATRFDGAGGQARAIAAAREKSRRDRAAHAIVAALRDQLAAADG